MPWHCSGCAQASASITNIEKTEKIIKIKASHGTYEIAADGMTGGWSHDQFANRVKKETTKS